MKLSIYNLFANDFDIYPFCPFKGPLFKLESRPLISSSGEIKAQNIKTNLCNLELRLYFTPETSFLSAYIPNNPNLFEGCISIIRDCLIHVGNLSTVSVRTFDMGDHQSDNYPKTLPFANKLYIYSDFQLSDFQIEDLVKFGLVRGITVQFRSINYLHGQSPLAFISHEFSEQEAVVSPLVFSIYERGCKTWYCKVDLNPGDHLKDVFETYIEKCNYFIPVLTPKYLANKTARNWTRKEFIYAKKLNKPIISVCFGVNHQDIKKYDKFAADKLWLDGKDPQTLNKIIKQLKS